MRIPCPWCGERDVAEFAYGGDAGLRRPDDAAPLQSWIDYVYFRDNPRGPHLEHWQHVQGCRAWIVVERDSLTHAITGSRPAIEAAAEAAKTEVPV